MLRLAFDFIITWRETRTRPNAYTALTVFFHCQPPEILKNLSPSPAIDFRKKNKVITRNAILFIIVKFYSVKASA